MYGLNKQADYGTADEQLWAVHHNSHKDNKMIIQTITITTTIIVGYLAWKLYQQIKELKSEVKKYKSQVKSKEVMFGKSFENFVPFIKDFPGNREKTIFLGMPIDLICFDEDSVKFIEVKTGVSQLSPKQKKIKKQIEDGKVEFLEVRY